MHIFSAIHEGLCSMTTSNIPQQPINRHEKAWILEYNVKHNQSVFCYQMKRKHGYWNTMSNTINQFSVIR